MTECSDSKTTTILHFPRAKLSAKRGRPKILRAKTDYGTPELVIKKLKGETAETLDLCLERKIITPEQHWCGIHLRWLYTLRYGVPGVRAVDPTHLGGRETCLNDPDWRLTRELEYQEAINHLTQRGYAALITNICIYNENPVFLEITTKRRGTRSTSILLTNLSDGLDILAQLWNRSKKK